MAIKERYRNNIGYLYKMSTHYSNTNPEWDNEGIPFRYNEESKNKKSVNPMSGTYVVGTQEIWLTDTQIDFNEGDRVSFKQIPINDADDQDFSLISNIDLVPINEKGNRYRNNKLFSRRLTLD